PNERAALDGAVALGRDALGVGHAGRHGLNDTGTRVRIQGCPTSLRPLTMPRRDARRSSSSTGSRRSSTEAVSAPAHYGSSGSETAAARTSPSSSSEGASAYSHGVLHRPHR